MSKEFYMFCGKCKSIFLWDHNPKLKCPHCGCTNARRIHTMSDEYTKEYFKKAKELESLLEGLSTYDE